MKSLLILVILAILSGSTLSQLPEGCIVPPGNNGVADLIVAALEAARPLIVTGIPSLGIPPLDPLGPLGSIDFHVDGDSLRLDGQVNQTRVTNLSKFIICSLNFTLGLSQKFDVDFRLDNFHMDGFYEVDGLFASLFPIFGSGDFLLDAYNTGIVGGAAISYNPITDIASIKNLHLDIFFSDLVLELQCILGCGDMADLINSAINEIAPPMFEAIWNAINPILTSALENGINEILKNISISDIITPEKITPHDLGNANEFMDLVMTKVDDVIVQTGLDPAQLPEAIINLSDGTATIYDGSLVGLSKLHRDGTCSVDRVTSWLFLYANIACQELHAQFSANVTSGGSDTTGVMMSGTVGKIAVYFVARQDVLIHHTDFDQFVITEFGNIDIEIDGLGILGHLAGELGQAVANILKDDITDLIEGAVKDIIQDVLDETPWP